MLDRREHELNVQVGGTIGQIVLGALNRFPDRIAFRSAVETVSYAETKAQIAAAQHVIKSLGLQRGDTVVQLTRNRCENWFVAMALVMSGMRSVALHASGSVDDHAYIVNDSDAKLMILDAVFVDRLDAMKSRCQKVSTWLSHDVCVELPGFWQLAPPAAGRVITCTDEPEDIVRLAYTGGTTGLPKGVMLSSRSLATTALLSLAEWEMPTLPKILCSAPISHGAGSLIVPTLARGGTIILQAGFDADKFLDAIEQQGVTGFYGVPTMLYSLMDHPRAKQIDWSKVEFILYGGAPMSPARIVEAIDLFGPVLNQAYGQTEAPSCITLLRKSDHTSQISGRLQSCGQPYPGISVRILRDDGSWAAIGETGELCVRGAHVMSGYWQQPEQTAQAFKGDWLHTGDLAFADADGFLTLVDRKKDMIITGGFNVYPKEVENALEGHPAVATAIVIGVPDPKWGEAVRAFVIVRSGMTVDAPSLLRFVRDAKGPVNTPKVVEFVDSVPLTALGKPDKKVLRARYFAENGMGIT